MSRGEAEDVERRLSTKTGGRREGERLAEVREILLAGWEEEKPELLGEVSEIPIWHPSHVPDEPNQQKS